MSKVRHHDRRGKGPRGMEPGRDLATRWTRDAGNEPWQRPGRRKGTVLIFVVAILGVLFVSGIAFLTSINFEAKALKIEKNAGQDQAAVAQIERIIEDALVESFVSGPGQTGGTRTLSEFLPKQTLQNPENVDRIRVHRPTWTELPDVHGLFSALEPRSQGPLFAQPTNFDTLRRGTITRTDTSQSPSVDRTIELGLFSQNVAVTRGELNTSRQDGIGSFDGTHNLAPFERTFDNWDALAVDSDGDGIVDTRQHRLFDEDLPADQFETISRTVNDPANPQGRVYVGARVIPHGAMVNLNDGHPNLLRAVLAYDKVDNETEFIPAIEETNAGDNRHGPYLPAAEEPTLRRRFMFPPAEMATTAVQGDPADLATNDPPGGGDFGTKLFPLSSFFPGRETVYKDGHQYWPFGYNSPNNDHEVWEGRMNPASAPETYDRRHRVTTVSHDDLITRGAAIDVYKLVVGVPNLIASDLITGQPLLNRNVDVLDLMRAVARGTECSTAPTFGYEGLPFESLDYPHTVASAQRILNDLPDPLDGAIVTTDVTGLYSDPGPVISWCECEQNSFQTGCRADVRKGRLRLSLPWLDEHTTSNPDNRTVQRPITVAMRNDLIYEAFEMMLLAARPRPNSNLNTGWGAFTTLNFDGGGNTGLMWVRTPAQYKNISRTAASLTANMIDFMDTNDVPTRIAVRNFELNELAWDQTQHALPWGEAISRPYAQDEPDEKWRFVYGLERQPYITEVTAYVQEGANPGEADPTQSGYAVELFNPNNDLIDTSTGDYFLRFANSPEIPLVQNIPGKGYSVLYTDIVGKFGLTDGVQGAEELGQGVLSFMNGDTIYLIRRETYDGNSVDIVLDEFQVGDSTTDIATPTPDALVYTLERRGVAAMADFSAGQSPWFAPFPADPADAHVVVTGTDPHSLGKPNVVLSVNVTKFPVEVYTADTGTFASAFPTTGSMLLLMRFANLGVKVISNANLAPGMAFTSHLEEDFAVVSGSDTYALDNGRMPVFDTLNLHHVPAAEGESADPWNSIVAADDWEPYRPGEPMHLPWGQLLFDYFTALPLENEGPYRGNPVAGDQVDPAAQARVDMGGLRVHGRININAAPWIVMQGLPLMPMERFDYDGSGNHPVYKALKNALPQVDLNGGAIADDESGVLGRSRAMAIAAYRDVRDIGATGDYGDDNTTTSRGWADLTPEFRRGTGFLSVGELANVRHVDAGAAFRLDSGTVEPTNLNVTADSPYLDAIAVLVSLGDWVTVRSHVFTIYGTVRGGTEPEPDGNPVEVLDHLEEVNQRAIRFQKTIDRLPTFMGRTRPETIGDSVIAKYLDVLND